MSCRCNDNEASHGEKQTERTSVTHKYREMDRRRERESVTQSKRKKGRNRETES